MNQSLRIAIAALSLAATSVTAQQAADIDFDSVGRVAYDHYIMLTPRLTQILTSGALNFITNIHIGQAFNMEGQVPRLGADVPRWHGETIGFWDKKTLITWTSNIQSWATHSAFEHSSEMQPPPDEDIFSFD